jgi:hypothetical protein
MSHTATVHVSTRVALLAATAMAMVLATGLLSPAAAFVEEEPADESGTEDSVESDEPTRDGAGDDGFVDQGADRSAPTGGVDAGLGGTAGDLNSGMVAATFVALLVVGAAGTSVGVRRLRSARGRV